MQKPLVCIYASKPYIYVQLYHFNGNEKNLFITIKVKLLDLHIGAWWKCSF